MGTAVGSATIVVPARDAASTLRVCLAALVPPPPGVDAVIVVDDGSVDDTAAIARQHGAVVVTMASPLGPAAARNAGVAASRTPVVVFIDADVVASPAAVGTLLSAFADARVMAAFGSYDDRPAARTAVSLFKNLLHHHVHQHADDASRSFWAGFGAIRREAFDTIGGFDARRYPRPSIEDIELGARLASNGAAIRLVKAAQVTHLKRWTFPGLVRTDVRDRAWPWSRLLLEGRAPGRDLNIRASERVNAVLAAALVVALGTAAITGWSTALVVAAIAGLGLVSLNRALYHLFVTRGGWWNAPVFVALHVLYLIYSASTFAICAMRYGLVRT